MRRVCNLIAGAVTAFTLTGCGETTPETGPVPFKGTQSPAIEALRENMSKNAAGKGAKASDAKVKPATDTKAADAKATDTKDAGKKD
jgi:hypothetical protein